MTDGDSRLPGLNHGGIAMSCNPPLTFHCARPGVDAALTGVTVAVKNVAAEGRLDRESCLLEISIPSENDCDCLFDRESHRVPSCTPAVVVHSLKAYAKPLPTPTLICLTRSNITTPRTSPSRYQPNLASRITTTKNIKMSQKLAVNESTSFSTQPATQTQLTTALVDHGSIPVIQNALLHELQASGWSTNLKNHVTQLMRSGECTKYDDLMDRILEEALGEADAAKDGDHPSLAIPDQAITQAVKIVKKELDKICQVETA